MKTFLISIFLFFSPMAFSVTSLAKIYHRLADSHFGGDREFAPPPTAMDKIQALASIFKKEGIDIKYNSKAEVEEIIIKEGTDINKNIYMGWTFLHFAIIFPYHNPAVAQLLIDNGADINAQTIEGQTALHHAAVEGYFPGVKLLVDNGADLNIKYYDRLKWFGGYTALHFADSESAHYLKKNGAKSSLNPITKVSIALSISALAGCAAIFL